CSCWSNVVSMVRSGMFSIISSTTEKFCIIAGTIRAISLIALEKLKMEKSVVGTLLDSYSTFGRFEVSAYYTVCFGILPSNLNVRVDLIVDRSQAAIDTILNLIDLQRFGFEQVFKNWITDDTRHGKPAEDYPFEYLFKS